MVRVPAGSSAALSRAQPPEASPAIGRPGASEDTARAPGDLRRQLARSIRDHRTRAGRSLSEVAASARIGKSTLHAIEAGDGNPGIETLWAIASALDVSLGDLLSGPAPAVRVVRAGTAPRVGSDTSTTEAFLLATTSRGAHAELHEIHLDRGHTPDGPPHPSGTMLYAYVLAGQVAVGPTDARERLDPGDLATFPPGCARGYEATMDGTRLLLLVEYT